jgi:hypothetical protein
VEQHGASTSLVCIISNGAFLFTLTNKKKEGGEKMNWQSTSTSEVNKEKIWSELVKKEHRELRVFDTYRSSTLAIASGKANTAPVSERQKRFLNKSQLLFESSIQMALPELRQRSSSSSCDLEGSRYALPLRNMQHRCMVLSPALSSTFDKDNFEGLSRNISSNSISTSHSVGSMSCGGSSSGGQPTVIKSASAFLRPTSASEIGSMVSPLVKHRVASYRYSIPKTDIRNSVHQ